ncbi:hypothetical protein [Terriglobus sp. RCC_193]|uniref:hypothetical protein n=1 Tax=Terriglobus sp. RCC_193 TaxID=3239218 RepID=UPI00352440E9
MPYFSMPTKDQWKRDIGFNQLFGFHKKSPFPAMERIGRLIDDYDTESKRGPQADAGKLLQMKFHMLAACGFVQKYGMRPEKLGGTPTSLMRQAIYDLKTYIESTVRPILDPTWTLGDFAIENFGRSVDAHDQSRDQALLTGGILQWFDDAERARRKLAFRGGLAYRWSHVDGGKGNLELYDTDTEGDDLEDGGSLYAMDQQGHIYVHGANAPMDLLHSSFLAGKAVLSAGTIRIVEGQIVWVSTKSGHYKPSVEQMLNLLERLRVYSVNLDKVTVLRENYQGGVQIFPQSPNRFESCDASKFLKARQWPTGVQPNSMHIPRT